MNGNIIKQDSLLSNISNITVKIDHNRKDGSGLFKNFIKSNENQMEIPVDAIDDFQSINNGSLLDRIMFKTKDNHHARECQHVWVTEGHAAGLSEEEDPSEEAQDEPQEEKQVESSPEHPAQQPAQQPSSQSIEPDETDEIRKQKLLMQKRMKNQTKNIPKNYGKAIISFIEKYEDKVRYVTEKNGVDYEDFVEELKEKKKVINTIADLRSMWVDYRYAKCIRLLSNLFLRKYALNYIFNSRICNYSSHIKYRYRLCEAIKEPFSFKHIKDY